MSSALGSRSVRGLLIVGAGLGAISLFLLATATANTRLFAGSYDVLLVLNTVMVGLLMALVGYQLWRLRRKLRKGIFGSRLALRLVLLFALVAVLPGALVYAVSVQFLGRSIESWFDVRVDRALDGGLNLGRSSLDYLLKETGNKAAQMALSLSEGGTATIATRLARAAEQAGLQAAAQRQQLVAHHQHQHQHQAHAEQQQPAQVADEFGVRTGAGQQVHHHRAQRQNERGQVLRAARQ